MVKLHNFRMVIDSASRVSTIFQRSSPDKYVNPQELGWKCTYEIHQGALRPLGEERIAGYKPREINSLDKLYGMIHPLDQEVIAQFSVESIQHMNNVGVEVLAHRSKVIFRAVGRGGKLYYLQRHGIASGVANGLLVSNYSIITDVTWMRPKPGSWKIYGPDCESFDFEIPQVARFRKMLGKRELEIIRLIARGFGSSDIAGMLHISVHTVNTHRKNMIRKLDVANSPELIALARDLKLI